MSQEISEELKEEARVKARQYAELMNEEYVDPYPPKAAEEVVAPVPVLSNEDLIKLVGERTGIALSSLDDLNRLKPERTEDEIAAERQKRETEMFTYGLTAGKFKKDDYDAYLAAVANKKDLVKTEIRQQLQTAFPEMAPEAIEEKVANYFFEHLEETDPLRIARDKEIATLSDIQIKNKFGNIVNLPQDFDQYQAGINNKATFERKVQATLPVYKADVATALKSLQHFTVPVPDSKNPDNTVNVELSYSDVDLKEVEELFLTPDQIVRATKEGLTVEQIAGEAKLVLMEKHLPRLISQAAKKYNSTQKENYLQARKGLNPGMDAIEVIEENTGSDLDKMYDEMIANAGQ